MKKLMIVLAAVALAGVTQAASFQWKTATGQYVYKAGTTTKAGSMTAYLFDSSVVAQTALLDGILNQGKAITAFSSLSSKATSSSGAIATTDFDYSPAGSPSTITTYFAIIDGDNVFISGTADGAVSDVGVTMLSYSGLSTPSKAAAAEFTGTQSSVGWYKAASAVPEPTSGILMLVGLGALALRRRRA